DVQVLVSACTGFGVIVVQAERVRRWLLQEIDDVAILVRALGETTAFGCALPGAFPAARVRERPRLRRLAGLRARLRLDDERGLAGRLMHEADLLAAIFERQHLRWHVAFRQLIPRRQDDDVPPDAEAALEDNLAAFSKIARGILVRLDDAKTRLPSVCRHGAGEMNPNVVGAWVGVRQAAALRLRAADLLEL